MNFSDWRYSIEFKGDKEYFIGFSFNYTKVKYNNKWYTIGEKDYAKVNIGMDGLYNSMDYIEEAAGN